MSATCRATALLALVARWCALGSLALGSLGVLSPATAQTQPPSSGEPVITQPVNGASAIATPLSSFSPRWLDLTPEQQVQLRPLSSHWDQLKDTQKRKWMALGANYPTLSAQNQAKLHGRMTEWVKLTQQQRAQARLAFASSQNLSTQEKQVNWQAYQALSAAERQKLLKAGTAKVNGAATATKPVVAHQLIPMTSRRTVSPALPDMPKMMQGIHPSTLLPLKTQP